MQIKCPECQAKLTLGQPKPGRYRPKCKHCGKAFVVQVGDGDPPKVAVGKLKPKSSPDAKPKPDKTASPKKSAPTVGKATDTNVDATIDSVAPAVDATIDSVAPSVDATIDSVDAGANATRGAVDATIDSVDAGATATSGTEVPNIDATMDSAAATVGSGKPGASQTAGGADATTDQTMAGASTADKPEQSAAKIRSGTGASKASESRGASANVPAKSKAQQDADELSQIPERLGGYRILRILGRGAMGAVYEAKQVSLDRIVALKTIRGRLANNAASLARFTREAYAAAQLTHHNVVQIYDFGEDDGKHFFSMEWVRGGPLSDLIRDKGPIEPKLAIGYTLQAARGLQFAHRNGMVHRDVKPANLLLSDEGVVKVADLGLVKIPDQMDLESDVGSASVSGGMESGTQVTMQGTAVGTPAYMAPEQGIDAASVDHRADIYSLGCSLFFLLAGRPPFDGSNVSEVLEQHAKQKLPELKEINARIPSELQSIIERSMAKRPSDRYDSLAEMITDMESYLGVNTEGKFAPTTQQADEWEAIAKKFNRAAPMLSLAGPTLLAFTVAAALLTVAMPFVNIRWLLFGPALFMAGIVTAIMMAGDRSAVAASVRRWISSLGLFDYVIAGFGAIVILLVVFASGVWPGVLAGVIAGAIAGATYHLVLVAPSRRSQADLIMEAEKYVRDLRIEGADEDGIRSFAARYAGKKWQALFEALFGYDSLCKMREQLKTDPKVPASSKRSGLRDRVCASFLSKAETNRQARDQKRLAKIEERGLESEGVSAEEARERAEQMAAAIIQDAKLQAASIQKTGGLDASAAVEAKRARQKAMMEEARSGKFARQRDPFALIKFLLGAQTRFLAGCILLGLFAVRAGLVDAIPQDGVEGVDGEDLRQLGAQIPDNLKLMGIAGALLVMSAFVSGWRMTPFALIATIVILFGTSFGIPTIGPLEQWMVVALIGVVIYLPGVLFGESREEE